MLLDHPVVLILFQYGLFEASWFNYYWQKYLQELKSTLTGDGAKPEILQNIINILASRETDFSNTANKRKEREKIREKMKSILSENNN
jgi:hypothetical protein